MDREIKKLASRFEWKAYEEMGIDKYEAAVVASKFARYIFRKYRQQNIELPEKEIFVALDALRMGKIKYEK